MFELRDARIQREMVDKEAYKRKMEHEEKINNFVDYVLTQVQKSLDRAIKKLEYTSYTEIFGFEIERFKIIPDLEVARKISIALKQKNYDKYEISTEPFKIIIKLDFSDPNP